MKKNVKIFLVCLILIFVLLSLTGCSTETAEVSGNAILENSILNITEEQEKKDVEEQAKKEAEEQAKKQAEEQAKKETEKQTTKQTSSKVTVPASETGDNLVWIPTNGGKKYHSRSGCSNMKSPNQVTKETAEANGFTPCKKCY